MHEVLRPSDHRPQASAKVSGEHAKIGQKQGGSTSSHAEQVLHDTETCTLDLCPELGNLCFDPGFDLFNFEGMHRGLVSNSSWDGLLS